MIRKKSQVWVETAIYTLIGLTIIAILLAIVTPQLEKMKERAILKQTLNALNEINNEIKKVELTSGTIKIIDFKISKGKLEIDPIKNILIYTLENTNLEFSQKGQRIKDGDITIETEEYGKGFNVVLELSYENLDITYNGNNEIGVLNGPGSYRIQIENVGDNEIDSKTHIDFNV